MFVPSLSWEIFGFEHKNGAFHDVFRTAAACDNDRLLREARREACQLAPRAEGETSSSAEVVLLSHEVGVRRDEQAGAVVRLVQRDRAVCDGVCGGRANELTGVERDGRAVVGAHVAGPGAVAEAGKLAAQRKRRESCGVSGGARAAGAVGAPSASRVRQ